MFTINHTTANRQVLAQRIYSTSVAVLCLSSSRAWSGLNPATAFSIFISNISANPASCHSSSDRPSLPARPTSASSAPDCHLSWASQREDSVSLGYCPSPIRDYFLYYPLSLQYPEFVSSPSHHPSALHPPPVSRVRSNQLLSPHQQGTRSLSPYCSVSMSLAASVSNSVVGIEATARGRVGSISV
jgi:hypothetical protein